MKQLRIYITVLIIILFSNQLFAGPLTNKEEVDGDALLSKQQNEEYAQRLERGLDYFDKGDYANAEKEFNTILTFAPKKTLAYFNLGLTKYKLKDYPAAINHFDKVIKMKSNYAGAALYYKAISQLNLGNTEGATKTASRYTEARFYYDLSQNLLKSIKNDSDEYFKNAQDAYIDGNFELCLLELEMSVWADTAKGIDLNGKCKISLVEQEKEDQKLEKNYRTELYVDVKASQSDNVYEVANDQKNNGTYSLYANGQVLWGSAFEAGIGAKYDQFNAFDLEHFKDETAGVFIPFVYKNKNHRVFADISYDTNRFDGKASYNDKGGSLTYLYLISNYSLGFALYDHTKKSEDTLFDYKSGQYQAVRALVTRYDGRFSVNLTIGFEDNDSNDQDFGTFFLPMANKAKKYSARLAYNLTDSSDVSLRGLYAEYDFTNNLSLNGVERVDRFTNFTLKYNYKWNKVLATYLSVSANKNKSTYDDTEVLNKNYTENVTSLGLTVSVY